MKVMPNGNLGLQEGIQSTRNVKYINKSKWYHQQSEKINYKWNNPYDQYRICIQYI